jgi:hypothetical protein
MIVSRPWKLDIRQLETPAWYCQMCRPSRCSLHQEEFGFGEKPRKFAIWNARFQQWYRGRSCDGLGSNVMISWYSILLVPTMAELLQGSTWTSWVIKVHPMSQKLFPNNDAVFQDDSVPIHTAGTVQSWFEEHECELQHHPWSEQSPVLNNHGVSFGD